MRRQKELHRHDSGQNREMSAGFFERPEISVVFPVVALMKEMGADILIVHFKVVLTWGGPGAVLGLVWLFVCNVNTVWCAVVVVYGLGGASDKKTALI